MRIFGLLALVVLIEALLITGIGLVLAQAVAQSAPLVSTQRNLLNQYCVSCHNQGIVNSAEVEGESLLITQLRNLGLTLDTENVDNVAENLRSGKRWYVNSAWD